MIDREQNWLLPPKKLTLTNSKVHIWLANLDISTEKVTRLSKFLSADEQIRADRFKFEKNRNHFIAARGILRMIASAYLSVPADRLQFAYSSRGKPSFQSDSLQFNLSHSHNLALYGFTKDNQIGVDLEYLRPMPDAAKIAQRFFSPQEYQWINSLSDRAQQKAFFQCWTAKEAYLKATGEGISNSLDLVEVKISDDRNKISIEIKQGDRQVSGWLIDGFVPQQDYIATVAVESNQCNFYYWQYIQ